MSIARSYLYVPADAPDKLARCLDRQADAVIVDLEDGVAPAAKAAARAACAAWLRSLPDRPGGADVWVRINPGQAGLADLRAVVHPTVRGLMVAKTETVDDLATIDRALTEAETESGMRPGTLRVVPLIESAAAVLRAAELAAAPRVERLQVGEADLTAETGISPGEDERELLFLRSRIVLVSAAYRLAPPVGPVATDFRDLERFRRTTQALRRLGYAGRACIHPAQVAIANELFTPTQAELDHARDVLARYDASLGHGQGVGVDVAGGMIDEAVARRARRILDLGRPLPS